MRLALNNNNLFSSQVLSLDISEFSPDAEDSRSSMLLAQMFYQFSLGVASRPVNVSSAAKSLGHAMHPAVPGDLTGMDNIAPSAGGAGGGNGGGSFMYGGDATAMRVPFRLTVHTGHERSSEQVGVLCVKLLYHILSFDAIIACNKVWVYIS